MRFAFPSLADGQIGFAFDSMGLSGRVVEVSDGFLEFQTYGDGLVQHSPEYPIPREHLTDYLFSLAGFLVSRQDVAESIGYRLRPDQRADLIAFAASVIFTETAKKQRFYSLAERRISTSDAKSNDRRYERIENWMDGSPDATARLLVHSWYGPWEHFQVRYAVREWWNSTDRASKTGYGWCQFPAIDLEWTKDTDVARTLNHAYEAVLLAVDAADAAHRVKKLTEDYRRRLPNEVIAQ